jgi:hypothetical protein
MTRDERDNLRRAIDAARRDLLAKRPKGQGAHRKPVEAAPAGYEYPRVVYNVGREIEPRRVPWVDEPQL